MGLPLQAEQVPLRINADGTVLVGQTRVPLETVVAAFWHGDSPEQIVDSFNSLVLADVYAVIAYYLNHRADVDAYIRDQNEDAASILRQIETQRPDMLSLRARLAEKRQL